MIYFILFLAFVLRFIGLNQSFWLDEAISALTAAKPFPYQITGITGDFQPPFYYLTLHFLLKTGITAEWFIRLPSVLFGVASVYLIYNFCFKLFGKKTALISALILATSQLHIYYSQEARMYSLLTFLTVLSMWFFYTKKWKLFCLAGILGIYSNYMYFFIFIPQIIWVLIDKEYKNKCFSKFVCSNALIISSFIPWMPFFYQQLIMGQKIQSDLPLWKSLSALPVFKLIPQLMLKFTLGRINFQDKTLYFLIFIALCLFYGYIFLIRKIVFDKNVKFVFLWLISPLICSLIFSFFVPVANTWRLLFLIVPFILLASVLIAKSKHSILLLTGVLTINAFAILSYYINPIYQRENWKEAVKFIEKDNAPVVFTVENGFAPYEWYNKKNKIICGPTTLFECLKNNRVYYVSYLKDLFDSDNKIEKMFIKQGFIMSETANFEGVGFIHTYENSN
jgi:mannosyltransferase